MYYFNPYIIEGGIEMVLNYNYTDVWMNKVDDKY